MFANYTKDVAFELGHGYNQEVALNQLKKTKIYSILEGVRGQPKSDINGLIKILIQMSQLVNKFPEINELDMNPLFVFSESEGIVAIDVKIIINDPHAVKVAAHHE